jgi:hypothetical protein
MARKAAATSSLKQTSLLVHAQGAAQSMFVVSSARLVAGSGQGSSELACASGAALDLVASRVIRLCGSFVCCRGAAAPLW